MKTIKNKLRNAYLVDYIILLATYNDSTIIAYCIDSDVVWVSVSAPANHGAQINRYVNRMCDFPGMRESCYVS